MVKFGHAHFRSYNNHNTIKHLSKLSPPCWLLRNAILYTGQEYMSSNYAVEKKSVRRHVRPRFYQKQYRSPIALKHLILLYSFDYIGIDQIYFLVTKT